MAQLGLSCQCRNLSAQAHSLACGQGESSREASPPPASLLAVPPLSRHLSPVPTTLWLRVGTSAFPSVKGRSSPPAAHLPEGWEVLLRAAGTGGAAQEGPQALTWTDQVAALRAWPTFRAPALGPSDNPFFSWAFPSPPPYPPTPQGDWKDSPHPTQTWALSPEANRKGGRL